MKKRGRTNQVGMVLKPITALSLGRFEFIKRVETAVHERMVR